MHNALTGRTGIAILVMIVTPLLFSSNLIFGKAALSEVAPFTLAFLRWVLVAAILSPLILRERAGLRAVLSQASGLVMLLGFIGMGICGGVVYLALLRTTATNATLIYTTSPVMILLLEAVVSGRAIGVREAVGSLIAFMGVAAIVLRGDLGALASLSFNAGDLLLVVGTLGWAVYSILYRDPRLSGLSTPALLGVVAAAGSITLLPFAIWEFLSGELMPVTTTAWTAIGGIVLLASLLAFSGFQFGLRVFGPSVAGIFMYLLPPYGVGLAVLLLGEPFEAYHAAGIALVMGGIVLATAPVAWIREKLER